MIHVFERKKHAHLRFDIIEEKRFRRILRKVDDSLLLPTILFLLFRESCIMEYSPLSSFLVSFVKRSYQCES